MLSSLFFTHSTLPETSKKYEAKNCPPMTKDTPSPPSPGTPPILGIESDSLDVAFDMMLLDPSSVAPNDFSNDWGAADTEEALAVFSFDARLKDCIVGTARGVLWFTSPPPVKIASGCSLDRGEKMHILCMLGVIECGIVLIFIPLFTMLADAMHKHEASTPTWGDVGDYHHDSSLIAIDWCTLHYSAATHRSTEECRQPFSNFSHCSS
jgi:hypothetical protein